MHRDHQDSFRHSAQSSAVHIYGNHKSLTMHHGCQDEDKATQKQKTLISTTVIFFLGRSLYSPLIMRLHRGSYGRHGGCLLGRRHGDRLGPAEIPTTPPPPSPQRYHSTP